MQSQKLSPRFTIHRRIGAGGFGAVFDVHDHVRDARVALKKLTRVDATTIYRFKREFRALVDVTHANLVRLHELVSIGGDWYITMDLVEGVDFRAYVRGIDDSLAIASTTVDGSTDAITPELADNHVVGVVAQAETAGLLERLRGAVHQLIAGVHALHQAGKLHRDIKPSNVLVTPVGHLVVLDFGLVTNLDRLDESFTLGVRGTPAYMSPEQAIGGPVSESSDWYSVGVMIYEALRGRLPFAGSIRDMMTAKQLRDPPDPRSERPELPGDLCDLAMALLRRDPGARPDGAEIIRRLGIRIEAPLATVGPRREAGPFVGRAAELEVLRTALARTRESAVVVQIHGSAGVGKTALVRRFLDELGRESGAPPLLLEGRCYERETVPYKAFDGIIDALSGHLRRLSEAEAMPLIPRDAAALARLFPTFTRLDARVSQVARSTAAVDPHELRRRAFGALREILGRLAKRQTVVLFLDDLQWGDVDSAALLVDLLAPPEPPPILLVACHRTEDTETSAFLRALRKERARGAGGNLREIALAALDEDETLHLARELLPAGTPEETVLQVARESAGNPMFVGELAHVTVASGGAPQQVSLAEVLAQRVAALPEGARELLELVTLAGRPIPYDVARHAAGLVGKEEHDALAQLRAGRLIRLTSAHERQMIESFSNRIRETVVAWLRPAAAASLHRRLARSLEASPNADPEALAVHLAGAGDHPRARLFAERAADRAAGVLAFDHAAGLYRAALGGEASDAQRLNKKLADALANAGRGVEAARTYLEARAGETGLTALVLARRAGEQLLRAGHIDEGLEVLREVLAGLGLPYPPGPRGALLSLLWNRGRLAVRGFGFRERPEAKVAPEELARIDACWSIGNGLGGVDLVRGADYQARHLLLALAAGEPYRIGRALAWEAILRALEGGPRLWRRAGDLIASAEALAERIENPHALAWAMSAAAIAAWAQAEWRRAATLCDFATALFRERCADIVWEIGSLEIWFNLPALFFVGELAELARRAPAAVEEAEGRGDRYAATSLRVYVLPLVHLAAGRPDEARAVLATARETWSAKGFHLQHWGGILGEGYVALYDGAPDAAAARLAEAWPKIAAAQLFRVQNIRIQSWHLRGRLALAAGDANGGSDAAARLEKESSGWARAYALSLRAGAAARFGERDAARLRFAEAEVAFDALGMALFAAAARRRRGELAAGPEGRELVAAADATLLAAGAADAARMASLLAPPTGV